MSLFPLCFPPKDAEKHLAWDCWRDLVKCWSTQFSLCVIPASSPRFALRRVMSVCLGGLQKQLCSSGQHWINFPERQILCEAAGEHLFAQCQHNWHLSFHDSLKTHKLFRCRHKFCSPGTAVRKCSWSEGLPVLEPCAYWNQPSYVWCL